MGEKLIPWWRTDLGEAEIRGVERAIRGRHINRGPLCEELQRRLAERLGVPHVVLTTSGSSAILLSLLACGVGAGDEVILPAGTFIAAAHAAMLAGARVRLVDVRPDRPVIDPGRIESAITYRTRAIMPSHLNGAGCDMAAVDALAARRGLKVVEDAAQAFCSSDARGPLGAQSDAGAFSMGITKLITTGEGGFVAARDERTHTKLLKLRNHGVLVLADNVFDEFGFNLRFNDMQAAVGLAQVRRLDAKIAALKRVRELYERELAGLHYLKLIEVRVDAGEVPLWTQVRCAEREKVVSLLKRRGIQARPFHPPLSDSKHLGCPGEFPVARRFAAEGLTLPSGPDQPEGDLAKAAAALKDIAGSIKTAIE